MSSEKGYNLVLLGKEVELDVLTIEKCKKCGAFKIWNSMDGWIKKMILKKVNKCQHRWKFSSFEELEKDLEEKGGSNAKRI